MQNENLGVEVPIPHQNTPRAKTRGPLSPLLFNLAVDALAHILTKAKDQGYVKGVVPHSVSGGITHLQYADDTIIMVGGDLDSISNLKFLLYCFEMGQCLFAKRFWGSGYPKYQAVQ